MERYDVVVVGGGPAGAVAAHAAAQGGARVLVVERAPHRPPRCTGLVGPRFLDLLSVPAQFVLREVRAVRVHAPGGRVVEFRAPHAKGYVLDRSGLDRWLLERATAAGAVVRAPVAAVGRDGPVLRTTAGPAEFAVLIAADGAQSAVRRWEGLPPPAEMLAGGQAIVETAAAEDDRVEVHLGAEVAPGGFGWAVPAEEGLVRVGLLTTARRDVTALLLRFLAERFPTGRVLRQECGLVPIGPPPRTAGEGVLLVGDAAGQVKPLSGGGLLYGTIAARVAGEVAAGQPHQLAEYEARWRAAVGDEIAFGLRGRRAFLSLEDEDLGRIVAALDRAELRRLVAEEGDIDRPYSLAQAMLARPTVWPAVIPLVQALGGWRRAREVALGLPSAAEPE